MLMPPMDHVVHREIRRLIPGMRHYRNLLNGKLHRLPRWAWLERRRTRRERDQIARLLSGYLSIAGDPDLKPEQAPLSGLVGGTPEP